MLKCVKLEAISHISHHVERPRETEEGGTEGEKERKTLSPQTELR